MAYRLTKIVTRSGDRGDTSLGDGHRVDKNSSLIHAIGEVDELNSALGLLLSEALPDDIRQALLDVQHDLFGLGGELALPEQPLVTPAHVRRLETQVEKFNANLPPLLDFVLPGGSRAAAICHLCRSMCRRAERTIVALGHEEHLSEPLRQYVNRLSDLLFVLARAINQADGVPETIWNRARKLEQDPK